jgi:hypothetical protein
METIPSRSSLEVGDPPPPPAGHARRARIGARILLLVALAISSVALTQCRMVGDRLAGVRTDLLKRKSDCVKACKETLKSDTKAEGDVHSAAVRACRGNAACLAAEAARHQAALQAIDAAFVACENGCHQQGGGSVGP